MHYESPSDPPEPGKLKGGGDISRSSRKDFRAQSTSTKSEVTAALHLSEMAPKISLKRRQDEDRSPGPASRSKKVGKNKREVTYETYDEAMDGQCDFGVAQWSLTRHSS